MFAVCFVLGMLITIAEPDLQVLAAQVSAVMNGTVLVYAVGIGVGAFLVIAVLRIVFHRRLSNILMLFYMLLFALALLLAIHEKTNLPPLAIGACVGVQGADAVLRDAFGVVALVAMTPLITIQLLGFRGMMADKLRERRAMRRILDADDQQIINFV